VPGTARLQRLSWIAAALALVAVLGCGGGDEGGPTPGTIIEGNAVQIFVKEASKIGWFSPDDPIDIQSEPLPYEEALAKATALNLSLYPTVPETPPFPGGLPGWLITARGDFYDLPGSATPGPDTPRRPAIAAAFVDTHGRLTYSMRFTDVTPAPWTPAETLPPAYP